MLVLTRRDMVVLPSVRVKSPGIRAGRWWWNNLPSACPGPVEAHERVMPKRPAPHGTGLFRWCWVQVVLGGAQPRRSWRTPCEDWLACASMAVPAELRIWLRLKEVISCAMSVSRMRDSEADR